MEEIITAEIFYRSFVKNDDSYNYLSKFVSQTEEFNLKKVTYDTIKEYLHLSGNCQEVLPFIKELPVSDPHNAILVLKAMCHILIRIASDLHIYVSAGTSITNEVLSYGMKTIFNFIKPAQKSFKTKLALHLLASMVALGKSSATQVVAKLDFSHENFASLLSRINFSEEEDVRTAFLNLIVLIITICDNNIIRQIVEVKGFLNNLFPGLTSDRVSTITIVLNTFRTKIIENADVPKTNKVRLFNDHSLKPVLELYTWKGPLQIKKYFKRKLGEDDKSLAYEVTDEEAEEVHNCAHEFMKALCCSYKFGILFRDVSIGSSGRNCNHVITNILRSAIKPYSNQRMSEFVICVLKACPDQLKYYLPCLKDSFVPRMSIVWVKAINFFKKIMESQDTIIHLFKSENKRPIAALIAIAKIFCFPELISPSTFVDTFKAGHPVLCYYLCEYLLSIMKQVKSILDYTKSNPSDILYGAPDLLAFQKDFSSLISQKISFCEGLQMFWNKATSENIEVPMDIDHAELTVPSLSDQLVILLEVMKTVHELSENSSGSYSFNFLQMLDSLNKCEHISTKELSIIRLKLLELCITQEKGTMIIEQKDGKYMPLTAILDVFVSATEPEEIVSATSLIRKVLWHTKVFDDCEWEIDVWLDAIKSTKAKHLPLIFEFVSQTLNLLLQQSILMVPAEVKIGGELNNINNSVDPLKVLNDKLEEEKKKIAVNENTETESSCNCFTSFIPASLQTLDLLSKHQKKVCLTFVEKALISILHHQYSTINYFSVIHQYRNVISSDFYSYCKMLHDFKSFNKSETDIPSISDTCDLDISNHLKQKFIASYFPGSSPLKCTCSINIPFCDLDYNTIRKIVWQLLTYINFELKWFCEYPDKEIHSSYYLNILKEICDYLVSCNEDVNEKTLVHNEVVLSKFEFFKEIVAHPVMLKLFLEIENFVDKANSIFKESIIIATKITIKISESILNMGKNIYYKCLNPLKQKMLCCLQKNADCIYWEEIDFISIIGIFSSLFCSSELPLLQEILFDSESCLQNSKSVFAILVLLMKQFLESKEMTNLPSSFVNSLILKYCSMPKKHKKVLKDCLIQLFEKNPSYASSINKDTFWHLMKHKSEKDLKIVGVLIEFSDEHCQLAQNYLLDNLEESNNLNFIYLVSKCLIMNTSNNEQNENFKNSIAENFWDILTEFLRENPSKEEVYLNDCNVGKAAQLLLQDKVISPKKLNKFWKLFLQSTEEEIPSPSKMKVLLELLETWKIQRIQRDKHLLPVLQIVFIWMTSTLSKEFEHWDLITFIKKLLQNLDKIEIIDFLQVKVFFQKALKLSMICEEIGKEVIPILTLLCEKSKGVNLPVQDLYNLVAGHSNFFKIMLSDVKDNYLKERIIELLIALVKLDSSVCKEQHISLFLGAYGATLSSIDRKLLHLMKIYSDNGTNMIKYSPFLWGKAAIAHYSILNNGTQLNFLKQAKLQDITSLISPDKIEKTTLHYPLKLSLQPSLELSEDIEESMAQTVYDMRFFLPLLANLLSPGSFVNINCFIESRLLMLVFTSLSSYDSDMRALGYYCLCQFYQHLESIRSKGKEIWLALLDCVRNSITSSNPKLPCIVSLFLAKVTDIFNKANTSLYGVLYKFIMVKPDLDVTHVPEFYKLFNSLEIEHRIHRLWLLKLLAEGLRTSLDFHICEKRYIFSIIQSYYWSSLSTQQEKVAILQIVSSAVKIESSAKTLCQNGLLLWLHNILEMCEVTDVVLSKVYNIVDDLSKIDDQICSTSLLKRLKKKIFETPTVKHVQSFPQEHEC